VHAGLAELRPPLPNKQIRNRSRRQRSRERGRARAIAPPPLKAAGRPQIRKGAPVNVTGKVKFFNESKGFAYADLIADLAALA
jgi:hypothetical protein